MKKVFIVIGVLACVYLAVGIFFRVTCMTALPTPGIEYTVGNDHYSNLIIYDINPLVSSFVGSAVIKFLTNIYYYPSGFIEHHVRAEKLYDKNILNQLKTVTNDERLEPGDHISIYDRYNHDIRIVKRDGTVIVLPDLYVE